MLTALDGAPARETVRKCRRGPDIRAAITASIQDCAT
jgi:hypothetical protein